MPRAERRRWIAVAAVFALMLRAAAPPAAASLASARGALYELPPQAQAGDLIFRQGTEVVSEAVMATDGGGYSHVGMLAGGSGHWLVVHATPSEVPGRADGVVVDTLEFFTAPERSRHQTIYHVQAGDQQRQRAIANAEAQTGRPFRIDDPVGTYCTQLVWQAWQDAGINLQVRPTHLQLPLIAGDYLLPSDLRASPRLRELVSVK